MYTCQHMYIHIIMHIIYNWKRNHVKNRNALRKRCGNKMIVRGLVIVTYAICNAYTCVYTTRRHSLVAYRIWYPSNVSPCQRESGKTFFYNKKKKPTHTGVRVEKDRRHEKRNVKAYKHIMLISFVLNTAAFCTTVHMNKTGSVPPLMAIHFLVFSKKIKKK